VTEAGALVPWCLVVLEQRASVEQVVQLHDLVAAGADADAEMREPLMASSSRT